MTKCSLLRVRKLCEQLMGLQESLLPQPWPRAGPTYPDAQLRHRTLLMALQGKGPAGGQRWPHLQALRALDGISRHCPISLLPPSQGEGMLPNVGQGGGLTFGLALPPSTHPS